MTTLRDRPSYEEDYHLWIHGQAARLRAMAGLRADEPIDWELLAEEVESLARTDFRSCCSWLELIMGHLLMLEHSRLTRPRGHWRVVIVGFRSDLENALTPSLQRLVEPELEQRYARARGRAAAALLDADPDLAARLPASCPYGWEQVTGDWWPEERVS